MPNNNRAVGELSAHGSAIAYKLRRENITTRVTVLQLPNKPHYTPDCGHRAPHVRHVGHLDGPARYLCRVCWRQTCANEARAALVSRWHALFRHLRPWATKPRGAVRTLAATLARLGVRGEVSYA